MAGTRFGPDNPVEVGDVVVVTDPTLLRWRVVSSFEHNGETLVDLRLVTDLVMVPESQIAQVD